MKQWVSSTLGKKEQMDNWVAEMKENNVEFAKLSDADKEKMGKDSS